MADVRPFIGVRYRLARGADASALLAPPYDVIDSAERQSLAARSPANVVRIDLPEDPAGGDRYAHAGALYRQWLADGTLVRDAAPSLTVYHQTFVGPDGSPVTRKGLIAGVRLEEFDAGIILPHEYTLQGPKEDRMNLFRACGATASQVFCVYDDPEQHVAGLLARATSETPLFRAHSDDGVEHAVWCTSDPEVTEGVRRFFEGRTLLIADGHHRYETSLHYRNRQRQGRGTDDVPANFAAIYLANMADPGTVVYPIHRLVRDVAGFTAEGFRERLGEYFDLRALPAGGLAATKAAMAAHKRTTSREVFAAVLGDGTGWTFSLREATREAALSHVPEMEPLRSLDVSILHALVLDRVLGIDKAKLAAQTNIDYVKNEAHFDEKVRSGKYQVGLLLPPPDPRKVATVAASGARMPQKSTYFFPKIASGVVICPLEG